MVEDCSWGDRRLFVLARLRERGAELIAHPGGTLLTHLQRVAGSLEHQGADASMIAAGLCHAAYGTAGFPRALLELSERALLASWIGSQAESLVYLYCAFDRRGWSADSGLPWTLHDRFSGALVKPPSRVRRALLELTLANELDVLAHAQLSAEDRAELLALVATCRFSIRSASHQRQETVG